MLGRLGEEKLLANCSN